MRAAGAKRPRELATPSEHASVPWTGRVPKPAMNKDSWVDYGSGFLRKSCDSCVSSKRRCDGQDPCTRCLRRKKPCHYTERKKCGPRSGQRGKGARVSTATHPLPGDQKFRAHTRLSTSDPTDAPSTVSLLESRYPGLRLGGSPSSHGATPLSGGELSGETTTVDFTDCSDAPPSQRELVRDESGGSWWSLEEQSTAPESPPSTSRVHEGSSYGRDNSEVSSDNNAMSHLRKSCQYDSGGSWKGDNGSAVSAGCVNGGSSGSGGDSSEDDGSEENLGQAEEEVAALLVHLGRSNPFFEGFP